MLNLKRFLFFMISICVFSGTSLSVSDSVKKLFEKADMGDSESQFVLGEKYLSGRRGLPQDYNEAVKWFKLASEQGVADAQNQLGEMYYNGTGLPVDYNEAVDWYTKAACQDYAKAQFNLGVAYSSGNGVEKDCVKAVGWYKEAADRGFKNAYLALGGIYYYGNGVLQNREEAFNWYQKAAIKGVPEAQFCLGVMYSNGDGVEEDQEKSVKWYSKAAGRGISWAQFDLALKYCKGNGVRQDHKIAAKWFKKAAAQGSFMSQFYLGIMYTKGIGVAADSTEGYKWLLLAESNGVVDAKEYMKYVKSKVTPLQIATAKNRLKRLKKVKGFAKKEKDRILGVIGNYPGSDVYGIKDALSSATGFMITPDGYIVTAAHAVKSNRRIEVRHGGKKYNATIIAKDISTDVAILKIEDSNLSCLPIVSSSDVKLGQVVFTVGYPMVNLQGLSPKFTEGSISSLSGVSNDAKCFQISVPIQPGNSGGPLVNDKGKVVGLVVATLNCRVAVTFADALPQSVNYALKSSYILSFVESRPDISQRLVHSEPLENRSLAIEKAEKSIVLILSYSKDK